MIEIGRVCVKIAGRDAGKKGILIDILDDKFVLLDGETRRRKVNILHLEPLNQVLKIEKNASHEEVAKALDEFGLKARVSKPKPKTERPRAKRKTPEQLRVQKEEKRKLRDFFKPKKKEEKAEETSLEEKAGLAEEKTETTAEEETEKPAKESKPKKAAPKKKE
ncbi:50S ribosomal protein L14e [Candidatus Woesearchaeota archaeon]|nr:50S ribosomal protein L14e [Candidatus Woesearchaeota archaeon]